MSRRSRRRPRAGSRRSGSWRARPAPVVPAWEPSAAESTIVDGISDWGAEWMFGDSSAAVASADPWIGAPPDTGERRVSRLRRESSEPARAAKILEGDERPPAGAKRLSRTPAAPARDREPSPAEPPAPADRPAVARATRPSPPDVAHETSPADEPVTAREPSPPDVARHRPRHLAARGTRHRPPGLANRRASHRPPGLAARRAHHRPPGLATPRASHRPRGLATRRARHRPPGLAARRARHRPPDRAARRARHRPRDRAARPARHRPRDLAARRSPSPRARPRRPTSP